MMLVGLTELGEANDSAAEALIVTTTLTQSFDATKFTETGR